jgi:predicted O-methyltransferase YrrM
MIRSSQTVDRATGSDRASYPRSVAVEQPSQQTIDFITGTESRCIAEIGIYEGHTTLEIANWLDGRGELHLFDYADRVADVTKKLEQAGYRNVKGFGCSYKLLDSYNWPLAQQIEKHDEPIYDYVFIDGAHTWAVDGFTTFLADRLLKPGGYMEFDDYAWTLAGSPSLRPAVFPMTKKMYSDEQIKAQQVKMILDLIMRRDPRYVEVVPNRIFQKKL